MFPGLGHNPFICRHHQQGQVNAASAREHVVNKFFMPRHINDACLATIGQRQVGEAQVNGDAPALLFFQAVSVAAGECADETGFAMVHMAGCSDDNMVIHASSSCERALSSIWARHGRSLSVTVRMSSSRLSWWMRDTTGVSPAISR